MGDMLHRAIITALVAVHLFLLAWAIIGIAEFVSGQVIWPGATNPDFPRWMLLAQWVALPLTALVFLLGYAFGWRGMPSLLLAGYAVLAALCAYQTFFLLTHDTRFIAMALEYAAYVAIGIFLFRSARVQARLAA